MEEGGVGVGVELKIAYSSFHRPVLVLTVLSGAFGIPKYQFNRQMTTVVF